MRIDEFGIGNTTTGLTASENLSWITFGLFDEEEVTTQRRAGDAVEYHFKKPHIVIDFRTTHGKKPKKPKKRKKQKEEVYASYGSYLTSTYAKVNFSSRLSDSLTQLTDNIIHNDIDVRSIFNDHFPLSDQAIVCRNQHESIQLAPILLEKDIFPQQKTILTYVDNTTLPYFSESQSRTIIKTQAQSSIFYENQESEIVFVKEDRESSTPPHIVLREREDFIINPELIAAIVGLIEENA